MSRSLFWKLNMKIIRTHIPAGKKLIFRPWITNPKTGERIYPKRGRFFHLLVDA